MREWLLSSWLIACSSGTPAADAGRTQSRTAPPAQLAPALRLALITDLEGVVEPCGCTRDSAGGLDRLSYALNELRSEPTPLLVLAAGALFFPTSSRAVWEPSAARAQDELKAGAIAALFEKMGVDVVVPSARDLARAAAPLRSLVRAGRVALPGVLAEDGFEGVRLELTRQLGRYTVKLSSQDAPDRSSRPRSELGLVVEICHGVTDCSHPVPAHAVDVRIRTELASSESTVSIREGVLELTGIAQGRELLVVELLPYGTRGAPWRLVAERPPEAHENLARVERHALDARVPSDPLVRRLQGQLFARINALHERPADPVASAGTGLPEVSFVGSRTCAACHTQAYHWWLRTSHARAFRTLQERGRELDLDCVGCHVTGFDQPGGAGIGRLDGLHGVGCESCHGPGGKHVDNPRPPHHGLSRAVPESRCLNCHDAQHSDDFHYQHKVALLRAPGHGVERALPTVRQAAAVNGGP